RNSLRDTISSQMAGTWCCQQPAPRKLRWSAHVALRPSVSVRCRRSAASERSAGGRSIAFVRRWDAGICSNSSSTSWTPIVSSIASTALGTETAMYGCAPPDLTWVANGILPISWFDARDAHHHGPVRCDANAVVAVQHVLGGVVADVDVQDGRVEREHLVGA